MKMFVFHFKNIISLIYAGLSPAQPVEAAILKRLKSCSLCRHLIGQRSSQSHRAHAVPYLNGCQPHGNSMRRRAESMRF
jgi:hypothetical protein